MEEKYDGLLLSDIHIKSQDYQQTFREYEFLKRYLENRYYDFCIILGDFFDRKIYSYEDYVSLALKYMKLIMLHCDKVRVVYGTKSHENDQYKIFQSLMDDYYLIEAKDFEIDFKVIDTVSEEELFPNIHVLYLPEEYILDKNEYYKEYFKNEKKYDYTFGHGVIKELMTMIKKPSETKSKVTDRKKPAVFSSQELKFITKGQIFFGHYHIHKNIDDKIFYVGSFGRSCFGEEEPKGFYEVSLNNKGVHTSCFIENTEAKRYITISYGYNHAIFKSQDAFMKEINQIEEKKKKSNIDYLRLIFNIPENCEDSEFFINIINEKFKFSKDIKVEIINGYVEQKKQANQKKIEEVFKEYDIIFDENASDAQKIAYFIQKKYEKKIPEDLIEKYLSYRAIDLLEKLGKGDT